MEKEKYSINDLIEIVKMLRAPDGCPWDREQTHKSIRQNLIEETYEAVEAIDTDNYPLLREELGDVLLQVVMHSEMADEENEFDFSDVVSQVAEKLVFRHPHVFGDKKAATGKDALNVWESMKRVEKHQDTPTETLHQVSKALPALMYSEKVQKRAKKVGFDYPNTEDCFQHILKELDELKVEIANDNKEGAQDELGDVLFSVVNLSRFLDINAEKALYDSTVKFVNRFSKMEELATKRGMALKETDLDSLNSLWEEAKNTL